MEMSEYSRLEVLWGHASVMRLLPRYQVVGVGVVVFGVVVGVVEESSWRRENHAPQHVVCHVIPIQRRVRVVRIDSKRITWNVK
jgi:hypothetical protein